jgi:hypothetical protein
MFGRSCPNLLTRSNFPLWKARSTEQQHAPIPQANRHRFDAISDGELRHNFAPWAIWQEPTSMDYSSRHKKSSACSEYP